MTEIDPPEVESLTATHQDKHTAVSPTIYSTEVEKPKPINNRKVSSYSIIYYILLNDFTHRL